jgi:hypothetical protein
MTYCGRTVLVGNYEVYPFVGYVLQSKSEQGRVLRAFKGQVNVVPSEDRIPEVLEQIKLGDLSVTHNSYPAIFGFSNEGRQHLVACNGRFAGAVKRQITRGIGIMDSIDVAFDASDPQPGDPRLIAMVSDADYDPLKSYRLGYFDITKQRSSEKSQTVVKLGRNEARYLKSANLETGLINLVSTEERLAEHLFRRVLFSDLSFGIGSAVAIFKKEGTKILVFNA